MPNIDVVGNLCWNATTDDDDDNYVNDENDETDVTASFVVNFNIPVAKPCSSASDKFCKSRKVRNLSSIFN